MDQFFPGPGTYENPHDSNFNAIYKVLLHKDLLQLHDPIAQAELDLPVELQTGHFRAQSLRPGSGGLRHRALLGPEEEARGALCGLQDDRSDPGSAGNQAESR